MKERKRGKQTSLRIDSNFLARGTYITDVLRNFHRQPKLVMMNCGRVKLPSIDKVIYERFSFFPCRNACKLHRDKVDSRFHSKGPKSVKNESNLRRESPCWIPGGTLKRLFSSRFWTHLNGSRSVSDDLNQSKVFFFLSRFPSNLFAIFELVFSHGRESVAC